MTDFGKINYIEMPAKNMAATKDFFKAVFDWSFVDYGDDYAAIENAGIDGGFYQSQLSASAAKGSVLVVLNGQNLEATLDKVKSHGGVISQEIFSFPGGRRFHFLDPSENEFAVWSELSQ